MAKNIHTAILADGTTVTRTSDNRKYTHVVVDQGAAVTWAGSHQLGVKALATWRRTYPKAELVPCTMMVQMTGAELKALVSKPTLAEVILGAATRERELGDL